MKYFILALLSMSLIACSTTTSSVRQVMAEVDRSGLGQVTLAIGGDKFQTNSQGDTAIYRLHHRADEVKKIARYVAQAYGFQVVELSDANYFLEFTKAAPDGGACIEGVEAVRQGVTFSTSVLTMGVVPSRGGHCLEVSAWLHLVENGETELLAEFTSNAGKINLFAGANEVDNYRRTVTRKDEVKALEASIGGLLNVMIEEGAFQ